MSLDRQKLLPCVFDDSERWDVIVVGGGATGVGAALDAASRGYRTVLFEQSDFGKATSSRSTKLIHGGVRYLRQGNISLVRQALRERSILQKNAPHAVHSLPFVVPAYRWGESTYYGTGLKLYDWLGGGHQFGASSILSREDVMQRLPGLSGEGLRGGVIYHDGQFDDARLLIHLAQTAAQQGAVLLNYVPVVRTICGSDGLLRGVLVRDQETGREKQVLGRCVINATGAFCDALRRSDDSRARPMVSPSQGAHVVLDKSFLPGETALMLPRTSDGRVLFVIPWHERLLLGTTDTAIDELSLEPRPLAAEIHFLLETAGKYLARKPTESDILSSFAGIRPLVRNPERHNTASLSREHFIEVSRSGMITITGGKWTTYRAMACECINLAATVGGLPQRACVTANLKILGSDTPADVRRAVQDEAARTVEDFLARRTRTLQLDTRTAMQMAAQVAREMAELLGRDSSWQQRQTDEFLALARGYLPTQAPRS